MTVIGGIESLGLYQNGEWLEMFSEFISVVTIHSDRRDMR